jgi:spore coat polysaccharide biosynthesis protein SpsF (cytidylyltransferase family)
MPLSEFEIKKIEKEVGSFVEKRRPPPHIRDELDVAFRVKGQSVEIFEVRRLWNDPKEKIEEPVAKATYVKTQKVWKVYWQRADLRWHRYDPDPEVDTLKKFLDLVDRDEYACFFG